MKLTCISTLLRGLRVLMRQTWRTLFPCSWMESVLFLFFFLLYGLIGYNMLYHSDLIDVQNGGAGSYLGYDNLFHYKTNGGGFDVSHPFFSLFHFVKCLIVTPFEIYFGEKSRGVICLGLMNLLVSGGLVLLYRYLKQIVAVSTKRALLLTLFTGSFFTTVVLSFTTETYPFSFCFLIFSLLMLSREYKLTGCIKGRTILFLTFLCGGVTITNAVKPATAVFLNKAPFLHKIRTGFKVMLPFVACVLLFVGVYTLKFHLFSPDEASPIETTQQLGQYFIHDEAFSKQALVDFWGNTVMSTPLTEQIVGKEVVLRPGEYLHGWQNAVAVFLLVVVAASACLNIGNRYVQLILMYVGIDLIIHFYVRYGMNEAIIFGGHWMFVIPILLGWLYNKLPVRMYRILDWVITGFLILTVITNSLEFTRLWENLGQGQ